MLEEKGEKMFRKKAPQIELNPDILKNANIPLLIQDKQWKTMTKNIQNRKMKQIVRTMEEELKEQKRISNSIQTLKSDKKKVTQEILEASYAINHESGDDSALLQLEAKKELLKNISFELDQCYERLEAIPQKLKNMNFGLLQETVNEVCEHLIRTDQQNRKTDKRIRELRDEMNQLRLDKEQTEYHLETWYSFIHHLVGPKEMEKLDQQLTYQPKFDKSNQVK